MDRIVLCLKNIEKGDMVDNYRPMICLPFMRKLLVGIVTVFTGVEEGKGDGGVKRYHFERVQALL